MKKFKLILLITIFMLSLSTAFACGGNLPEESDTPTPPTGPVITLVEGTKGLTYEITTTKKGVSYAVCTGYGTATDEDIVIASHYNDLLVKEVKANAFKNNTVIKSVTFVNGMEKLNMYAFQGCTSLFSITLSETLDNIGHNVFFQCENLLNICNNSPLEIKMGSSSLGYVGNYACNIYSATSGGAGEFVTEGDFEYFTFPNNKFAMEYNGNETNMTIPSGVTGLYKDLFKDNAQLKSVFIPSSVTIIGKMAFANCTALESVTVEDNSKLATVNESAFVGCEALTTYDYQSDLDSYLKITYAGDTSNPSYYSKSLRIDGEHIFDVYITDGLKTVSPHAFTNVATVRKILIPTSLEEIGAGAFAYCTNLKQFWFKDIDKSNLKIIWNSAFDNCSSIEELDFPKSLEIIEVAAFNECKSLLTLEFANNNNLKEIRQRAFWYCEKLQSTFLGHNSKCEYIGEEAFRYCKKMTTFNMGNNSIMKTLARLSLSECRILKELYIPSTCTVLGDYVFSGCFDGWPRDQATYCKIYADFPLKPTTWHSNFNSSNCPVYYNTPYPTFPE